MNALEQVRRLGSMRFRSCLQPDVAERGAFNGKHCGDLEKQHQPSTRFRLEVGLVRCSPDRSFCTAAFHQYTNLFIIIDRNAFKQFGAIKHKLALAYQVQFSCVSQALSICFIQEPSNRLQSKPGMNVTTRPAPRPSQSLAVEVLRQNHVVVITQTETGIPRSFRGIWAIFSVSVYFALSWIPRIVVLLFFPQWVDPACSPVYFYRKLLVSRSVGG